MKNRLPLFIGVFVSFVIIWFLNENIIVDDCLDKGGQFQYDQGKCLLANGDFYASDLALPMMILYSVIGFSVSFFIAKIIKKYFKING